MITKVYFVRHAEPNYDNHNDRERELTAKGLKDREKVTEYLSDKNIQTVISSPYKRSYDTVKHFADRYNFEIEVVEDFRERRIDSVWIDDFESFFQKQWQDFNYKLKDGESLREVQDRNIQALKQVLNKYQGQNIVIGTHGNALSTIIDYYMEFGCEGFKRLRQKLPYVVCLSFDGEQYLKVEDWDGLTEI